MYFSPPSICSLVFFKVFFHQCYQMSDGPILWHDFLIHLYVFVHSIYYLYGIFQYFVRHGIDSWLIIVSCLDFNQVWNQVLSRVVFAAFWIPSFRIHRVIIFYFLPWWGYYISAKSFLIHIFFLQFFLLPSDKCWVFFFSSSMYYFNSDFDCYYEIVRIYTSSSFCSHIIIWLIKSGILKFCL